MPSPRTSELGGEGGWGGMTSITRSVIGIESTEAGRMSPYVAGAQARRSALRRSGRESMGTGNAVLTGQSRLVGSDEDQDEEGNTTTAGGKDKTLRGPWREYQELENEVLFGGKSSEYIVLPLLLLAVLIGSCLLYEAIRMGWIESPTHGHYEAYYSKLFRQRFPSESGHHKEL